MLFLFNEVRDETDRLNRLSKTHFVCENSVQVVIIQRDHPLETFKLLDSEHLHRKKNAVNLAYLVIFQSASNK